MSHNQHGLFKQQGCFLCNTTGIIVEKREGKKEGYITQCPMCNWKKYLDIKQSYWEE